MAWTTPRTWAVELVTVDDMNEQIRDNMNALAPAGVTFTSYTPTLSTFDVGSGTLNPTLGTGSQAVARYLQLGELVFYWGLIAFGSSGTNAGTGAYLIDLPIANAADTNPLGTGFGKDGSSNYQLFAAEFHDTTHFQMRYNGGNLLFTQSLPAGYWGANSAISWNVTYQAA